MAQSSTSTNQEELKERLEHRDAILAIRAVLSTSHGRTFVKYLLKSLDVGEVTPLGMEGNILMDRLGFLRAGNSVFKLISEANHVAAGAMIAEIEKEKIDDEYTRYHSATTDQ